MRCAPPPYFAHQLGRPALIRAGRIFALTLEAASLTPLFRDQRGTHRVHSSYYARAGEVLNGGGAGRLWS